MNGHIVTLTGPSCSGKTTLSKHLVAAGFGELVSTTTRIKRSGEENGIHYHFLTKAEFKRRQACGLFVEVVEFAGNYYGVSVKEVERVFAQGKPVLIVVEPNGAEQIAKWAAKNGVEYTSVYVGNKMETLVQRYVERVMSDKNTDAATHTTRLLSLLTKELAWRYARDWSVVLASYGPQDEQKQESYILGVVGLSRSVAKRVKKAA
jgi:guanylate kinase